MSPARRAADAADRGPRLARLAGWVLVAVVAGGLATWWAEEWHRATQASAFAANASPPAAAKIDLAQAAARVAGTRAFGEAPGAAPPPRPAAVVVPDRPILVRGVYGMAGGAQMAIVDAGEGERAVRVGAEITRGVTLAAVAATHIVVERGGERQQVPIDFNSRARPSTLGAGGPPPGAGTLRPPPVPQAGMPAQPPPTPEQQAEAAAASGVVPGPAAATRRPPPRPPRNVQNDN